MLIWKATKEYLNQKSTKIRVFRECFRSPFLPPFFPHFPLFPLQALFTFLPLLPSLYPPVWTPGKLRFRYPSDLGTLVFSLEESLESLKSLNSLESLENGRILLYFPQCRDSLKSLKSLNSLESLENGLF